VVSLGEIILIDANSVNPKVETSVFPEIKQGLPQVLCRMQLHPMDADSPAEDLITSLIRQGLICESL
jgi:hypothetical protein